MRIAGTIKHSMVNGLGIRFVVFFQGCLHGCRGCHNMETWDMNGGSVTDPESICSMISTAGHLDGVTLSGGDPFYQPQAAAAIARYCHEHGLSVWCYTGFTYEEILAGKAPGGARELLGEVDVLVDGPFIEELRSEECLYRGSSNQRLIDLGCCEKASSGEGREVFPDVSQLVFYKE